MKLNELQQVRRKAYKSSHHERIITGSLVLYDLINAQWREEGEIISNFGSHAPSLSQSAVATRGWEASGAETELHAEAGREGGLMRD